MIPMWYILVNNAYSKYAEGVMINTKISVQYSYGIIYTNNLFSRHIGYNAPLQTLAHQYYGDFSPPTHVKFPENYQTCLQHFYLM